MALRNSRSSHWRVDRIVHDEGVAEQFAPAFEAFSLPAASISVRGSCTFSGCSSRTLPLIGSPGSTSFSMPHRPEPTAAASAR